MSPAALTFRELLTGEAMQRRTLLIATMLTLVATACTTTAVVPGPAQAVAPTLVVEQFLRAVNAGDLDTMARLFGTREGAIVERDSEEQVDTRMFAIASVLRHQDYRIEREQIVPGRRTEATQLLVRLIFPENEVVVPFTMVLTDKRTWLIEQIAIERVTQAR